MFRSMVPFMAKSKGSLIVGESGLKDEVMFRTLLTI